MGEPQGLRRLNRPSTPSILRILVDSGHGYNSEKSGAKLEEDPSKRNEWGGKLENFSSLLGAVSSTW